MAAGIASAMSSCESFVYDEEGDCAPDFKVRFRYDYNLLHADAFSHEVNAVTLYVIDPVTGYIVWQQTESGEALRADDYLMDLDGLNPGDYKLMAWAGDGHISPEHFTLTDGVSFDELTCTINRRDPSRAGAIVDQDLPRLYKDLPEEFEETRTFVPDQGVHIHTVRLMRNTNDIHIVLQNLSGEPLDPADFEYEITASNGSMNWDNSLLPDEELTYKPWQIRAGLATGYVPDNLAEAQFSAAIADFTVGRMVTTDRMTLRITKRADGSVVAQIPVIDYALMVKGHYDAMPDQEYLDRQTDYSMVFFLDSNQRWLATQIFINSWHVVLNPTEL